MFAKQDKINVILKINFLQMLHCMSSSNNVNVNESPNHFMILDAMARGMTNISKIAKVTKINNNAEVELIVNDLLTQRLIVKSEIRGFLGRKKTEVKITETGLRVLNTKKQELEQKFQYVQQWYGNVNRLTSTFSVYSSFLLLSVLTLSISLMLLSSFVLPYNALAQSQLQLQKQSQQQPNIKGSNIYQTQT